MEIAGFLMMQLISGLLRQSTCTSGTGKVFSGFDDSCPFSNSLPFPIEFRGRYFKKMFVCPNGNAVLGEVGFEGYSPPDIDKEMNDSDFISKTMMSPFYMDITTVTRGRIYVCQYFATLEDDLSDNIDVITVDNMVKTIYNLQSYQSVTVVKVTWEGVAQFGGNENETSTFQMILTSNGRDTYVLFFYGWNLMNFQFGSPFIGWVANGIFSRKPITRRPDLLFIQNDYYGMVTFKVSTLSILSDGVLCQNWVRKELPAEDDYRRASLSRRVPQCPCQDFFFFFDRRFQFIPWWNVRTPTYTTYSFGNRYGRSCTYNTRTGFHVGYGANAGTFLRWNKFRFERLWEREDEKYRQKCCVGAEMCDIYHRVRPTRSCYSIPFFKLGGGFGDPHVQTLDNKTYTFNGHGEYILIRIDDAETPFELQARTERAFYSDGNVSDATVYSGFAMKEDGDTLLQVELNDDRTGINVWRENNDITGPYTSNDSYSFTTGPVIINKIGKILQATFPNSGISVNITEANGLLTIATLIPQDYEGNTSGLFGNFNGNPDDDFLPRGATTPLPSNANDSTIFFNFGKTWTTYANESIFVYRNGRSHQYYVTDNADFVPKFLDETDPALIAEAESQCNGSSNLPCIFDYVYTRNGELARATQQTEQQAQATQGDLANAAPEIGVLSGLTEVSGEQLLYVEVGQAVTFSVNSSDDGAIEYSLNSSVANAVVTPAGNQAAVSLTVTNTDPQSLSIAVVDDKNLEAVIDVVFVLCSGCNDHGSCNYSVIRGVSESNENFRYATCECEPYWDGDDCELDFDGCTLSACSVGRNCTDRPAAENAADPSLLAYTCSPCPTGYQDDGTKCEDIDECTTANPCSQNCVNTPGSFYCTCNTGYRLSGQTQCLDINECDEQISNCLQVCTNNVGSFDCSCYTGYTYDSNTNTCTQDTPPNLCSSKDCSNAAGCTLDSNGNATCFCLTGYDLLANDTCVDRDECQLTVCSQSCDNTQGSYTCGCYTGFQLENDGKRCTACVYPSYGDNCALTCTCGQGSDGTCDPVRGCVCNPGWEGVNCDTDINECLQANICGDEYKDCTNTVPSYTCTCRSGYTLDTDGTTCVDENECDSAELNTCEQLCTNTEGGFTCSCRDGYVVNPTNSTQCDFFDVCAAGVSGCDQICLTTSSGFSCDCNLGFVLEADRKTCREAFDPCADYSQINCSDICLVDNNQPYCSCKSGFKLGADNQTCIDKDECDAALGLNQCSEPDRCLNTDGGYVCSCSIGSRLENDGRTCTACDGFFGENCANQCNCGVGSQDCDPVTGCVCKVGWGGTQCNVDIDECGAAVNPCASEANTVCKNNPGSYECLCQTGYQKNATNFCVNVDECATSSPCDQICTDNDGSYVCSCNPGFTASGNTCSDVDECAGSHGCSQECVNTIGSYSCACPAGFRLDSTDLKTCLPENECTTAQANACDANADCAVVIGNPTCICRSGFQDDPNTPNACIDIAECSQDPNPCSQYCVEQPGSYYCLCNETGYQLDVDDVTCIVCSEGSWGDNCTQTCSCVAANTDSCNTVNGVCSCKTGWGGGSCDTDIDECLSPAVHNCPANSVCQNTNGSFICQCNIGFSKASDGTCQECDDTHYGNDCSQICLCEAANTQSCDNVDGTCTCNGGWEGTTCTEDIDECTTLTNPCNDTLKTCSNTPPGSYECSCISGYRINADLQCIDINECLEGSANCLQECKNVPGSFQCYCYPGFLGAGNTCIACPSNTYDYNCTGTCDCIDANTNNPLQSCDSTTGVCDCLPTWTGSRCETDVDECTLGTDDCATKPNTLCNNVDGGFECNCVAGFQKNAQGNCEVCPSNTYGLNCAGVCDCVAANTNDAAQTCDLVTGVCDCKSTSIGTPAWNGSRCEFDVDECATGTHGCENQPNQGCHNLNGSFECSCDLGYTRDSGGNCIQNITSTTQFTPPAQQSGIVMFAVFDLNVPVYVDFTVTATNVYYRVELRRVLLAFYRVIMGSNCVDVLVHAVERGSLRVNYTVVTLDTAVSGQEFAAATNDLANGTSINVFGTPTKAQELAVNTVDVNVADYSQTALACQTFLSVIGECSSGYQCTVEAGVPSCQLVKTQDNFALVIGLGVGIPLFFVAVLIVAIIIIYALKMKKRRHRYRTEDYDRGSFNQGFFPTTVPTKINTWGRGGPVYGPQMWEEEGSTSGSSDDRKDRHYRQRRDFDNTRNGEMYTYDNGVMSNFSWDFLYNYINPNERYEIQRPQHESQPNPMYSEKM